MIIIDNYLRSREKKGNLIKVGVVGCGEMGKGIINQISKYSPGIKVSAVYCRNTVKGKKVLSEIGIIEFSETDTVKELNVAVRKGITAITSNVDCLIEAEEIDILIEVTGSIDFSAGYIHKAFKNGKSVLSFNAELDSTFGPLLTKYAVSNGVKYSLSDGDQPGVTLNLFRYIKLLGFKPLLCGNIKGLEDKYRNPDTQKAFAESWGMNPYMVTSFADGTKMAFEQACTANATGFTIAQRGMFGFETTEHVDNLTHLFDFEMLQEKGGIVDYLVGAKPSPGVFIYATCCDPLSVKYLKYGKLGNGPLYSFYVPFHLLFFDIASSIARLIDFDDPVLPYQDSRTRVDVVATAKVELNPGDKLDGIGGFKTYGICETNSVVVRDNLLPMGLSQGVVVNKRIQKDQVISFNDIETPQKRFIDKLWEEQNQF